MAESTEKISASKRPFHFLLCCFGSSPKLQKHKKPANARRGRRLPSLRFRFNNSSATVPVDALSCDDVAYFSPDFKKPPPMKLRTPVVRAEIAELLKPSQTRKKAESTMSDSTAERFLPVKRTTALLHSVAAVEAVVPKTTDRRKPAARLPARQPANKFDQVIVIVGMAILVLWGRVSATVCTAALLYLSRRLGSEVGPGGGGEGGRSGFGKMS